MNPNEVELTVVLTDGRELSGTYHYMSAAQRVIEARKWSTFKEYRVTGPAAPLVGPILLRQTGQA